MPGESARFAAAAEGDGRGKPNAAHKILPIDGGALAKEGVAKSPRPHAPGGDASLGRSASIASIGDVKLQVGGISALHELGLCHNPDLHAACIRPVVSE